MQKASSGVLYSASDLVNFLECEHLTTLDLINLESPLPKTEADDAALLIQAKGIAHEAQFVAVLERRHTRVVNIAARGGSLTDKVQATLQAMRDGAEIIFQATLQDDCFVGHADFLRKVDRASALGDYSYEVLDTKLAKSAKAKFIIQLAFYSALLGKAQGVEPLQMYVVLGDQTEVCFRLADYSRYFRQLQTRFLERVVEGKADTYPDPCEKCDQCRYKELCEDRRRSDDHLCQVANITRLQTRKLQAAGITTFAQLAACASETRVDKMHPDTFGKLVSQAKLQHAARLTGENRLELLPLDPELGNKGFARMPRPDSGDLFFDMEGDPLEEGGLEYLFGLYFFRKGKAEFKAFWAHSRAEERVAFESFMDFVSDWLRLHPNAHIYHYAHYEATALKKLMSLHGTREAEVDNLLRAGKLIDLYKVVRESIRVSEPRYSIKNIEHFYLEARTGDVKDAGASIVFYERWKETGDAQLLKNIEAYNFDDVRSTFELREWLLTLRPAKILWANASVTDAGNLHAEPHTLTAIEQRLLSYRNRLLDSLPEDRTSWTAQEHLQELSYQLLDFHRRAAKPAWWAMFARMEMMEEDLIDDAECLGGLTLTASPRSEKRSFVYTYRFPEQETKLKTGDTATIVHSGADVRDLDIDPDGRLVSFKWSAAREVLPAKIGLGPGGPISTGALTDAIFRFADCLIQRSGRYPAIEAILKQEPPIVRGGRPGDALIPGTDDGLHGITEAISKLENSYVFVQGPPGAGKTFTGSHVIVSLMQSGFRVGVSSNSHKAINNLLRGVEAVAQERQFKFIGAKKSTAGKPESCLEGIFIEDVTANDDVVAALDNGALLVAGTAWLFADENLDQALDFIFIDEAGQVALANLVAMGTCARNIVLLGDQMQLGQPIQGVHPGRSGESSLEYLLNGMATIPPERGIFLATTWRMHPDVCRFISDAVYDGRLKPEPDNARQTLLLGASAHAALKPTGISYLPIQHEGCSQRSDQEAHLVQALVQNLLTQHYRDKKGKVRPLTLDDILIVTPYNMQVNLLKQTLPAGARVGTVDKFQGQEAPVVIVSMATSSGEDLPRHIEFLYSKNRMNVSVSRAKCLALFIANPALMSIHCAKPEEMALVNTLCWIGSL